MICPKCGCSDPTKILADIVALGKRQGYFRGWECSRCDKKWDGLPGDALRRSKVEKVA